MMAAQQGHTEVVCFLVGEGVGSAHITDKTADVTATNNNGETALTIAERFGASQELIDALKAAGATH